MQKKPKEQTLSPILIKKYSEIWQEANTTISFADHRTKLKWLLNEFLNADLSKASQNKRRFYGECLRNFSGETAEFYDLFMPDSELLYFQSELKERLTNLFDDQKRSWIISAKGVKEIGLFRKSPLVSKRTGFQSILRADSRTSIFLGVMDLLKQTSDLLGNCKLCHKPFIRSKRQDYCGPECSRKQREINRAWERDKGRLDNYLKRPEAIARFPSTQPNLTAELRDKLGGAIKAEDFWKEVPNGAKAILNQYLRMRGRKPKAK